MFKRVESCRVTRVMICLLLAVIVEVFVIVQLCIFYLYRRYHDDDVMRKEGAREAYATTIAAARRVWYSTGKHGSS